MLVCWRECLNLDCFALWSGVYIEFTTVFILAGCLVCFCGLFPPLPRRVSVHDLGCGVISLQKFIGLNTV